MSNILINNLFLSFMPTQQGLPTIDNTLYTGNLADLVGVETDKTAFVLKPSVQNLVLPARRFAEAMEGFSLTHLPPSRLQPEQVAVESGLRSMAVVEDSSPSESEVYKQPMARLNLSGNANRAMEAYRKARGNKNYERLLDTLVAFKRTNPEIPDLLMKAFGAVRRSKSVSNIAITMLDRMIRENDPISRYGIAHEIIRIANLASSGVEITHIGAKFNNIRYGGWRINEDGIVWDSSRNDFLDADASNSSSRTVYEIKSLQGGLGQGAMEVFVALTLATPENVFEIDHKSDDIRRAVGFHNQIKKLSAALQAGTVKHVELHITSQSPLDPNIVEFILKNIQGVRIYRYDSIATDISDADKIYDKRGAALSLAAEEIDRDTMMEFHGLFGGLLLPQTLLDAAVVTNGMRNRISDGLTALAKRLHDADLEILSHFTGMIDACVESLESNIENLKSVPANDGRRKKYIEELAAANRRVSQLIEAASFMRSILAELPRLSPVVAEARTIPNSVQEDQQAVLNIFGHIENGDISIHHNIIALNNALRRLLQQLLSFKMPENPQPVGVATLADFIVGESLADTAKHKGAIAALRDRGGIASYEKDIDALDRRLAWLFQSDEAQWVEEYGKINSAISTIELINERVAEAEQMADLAKRAGFYPDIRQRISELHVKLNSIEAGRLAETAGEVERAVGEISNEFDTRLKMVVVPIVEEALRNLLNRYKKPARLDIAAKFIGTLTRLQRVGLILNRANRTGRIRDMFRDQRDHQPSGEKSAAVITSWQDIPDDIAKGVLQRLLKDAGYIGDISKQQFSPTNLQVGNALRQILSNIQHLTAHEAVQLKGIINAILYNAEKRPVHQQTRKDMRSLLDLAKRSIWLTNPSLTG